jgi:hypothetical protein
MGKQSNKISVGGNMVGNVVAGNDNVVGPAPAPATAEPSREPVARDGFTPRLGFVVDVVGFGQRDAAAKDDVQERLDTLVGQVTADAEIDIEDTPSRVAGDSKVVFLPVGTDSSRVLPAMISAMVTRLRRDNGRYRDRMRLRAAFGTGLLGDGPLGFTGDLIIDLHRLVDSEVLRQAIKNYPDVDLAVLVSRSLHDEVIRPGFLDGNDFVRVAVATKEFTSDAWLYLR